MPVVAVVVDELSSDGAAVVECLPQLSQRSATWIVGNSLADFKGELETLQAVEILVFGGDPAAVADLWPHMTCLKWIHSLAAGVDTLVPVLNSLPGGSEIPLTNAKGAFSRSLAEYSLAAMLHFNKQIPRLQKHRTTKTWDKFVMNELHGQTVGFIGFGDIAQCSARLCKAFGMRILAWRNSRQASGEELADEVFYAGDGVGAKQEVFKQSDYVVCTLPGGSATYHCCGAEELNAMKPTAVFISLGRGSCVDEAALEDLLLHGKIAGAALDVFEKEPLPPDSPLWRCESLLMSPHNAAPYMAKQCAHENWQLFLERLDEFMTEGFSGFPVVVDKSKGY
ncbi:serA [Symbiodinium necroappetens]|uniref:SerA protein n=1 Tax=Symbiodinium necroappetens TaxID=1628268 RepID=A0A812UUH4_9DINO|nr:serA [Symbiodinium necroappetens]